MPNHPSGLTSSQRKTTDGFLNLYADVEKVLKTRLHLPATDHKGFGAMIDDYAARNPYWTEWANRLRTLAGIRNLLVHQRGAPHGYPVAVAPHSLRELQQIHDRLRTLEPVAVGYRKPVQTVPPEATLAMVLTLAFKNGFSQFPVVKDGRFGGLVTENEIMRWLGRQARDRSVSVDLGAVAVRTVLKEKDPFLRGIRIFRFEKPTTPVEEVMGRFSAEPALEAILLTSSGRKDTPLEGIVTQWDAARYRR